MHLSVYHLRVEYLNDPLGIDRQRPRLGWWLDSIRRRSVQTAYRIIVASSHEALLRDEGDMWDTGKIVSDRSQHIEYNGEHLESGKEYFWKVKVWDQEGHASNWSEPAHWSMGLLERGEWLGKWIGLKSPHQPTHAEPKPAVYLRSAFSVTKPVRRAVLHAAALGAYELYVNGRRIGDSSLAPDWTDYNIRLQYQTYEITGDIAGGLNGVGILLGHGWYSGYIGMFGFQRYGKDPRILVQLNIEYDDGSVQKVTTDESWRASFGPLIATDFHMGERFDARIAIDGWNESSFEDRHWKHADTFYDYKGFLSAAVCPPIKPVRELRPQSIERKIDGNYIIDMGQNMVGRVRIQLSGGSGVTVCLRHGEALDANGGLYTENLRLSRQTDTYIMNGGEAAWFEPHFALHGFRYVEVSGFDGVLMNDDVIGIVIHTDMSKAGTLETSHPLLNQLISNIEWTQRGNFISVPTDCPQRDERHGWTGDAQLFFRTACYQMDAASFFTKWLTDLTDAQRPTGAFTDFAPFIPGAKTEHGGDMTYDHTASAGWADAGVLVPWMMYQVYGDKRILQEHYQSMTRWIGFLRVMHPENLRKDLPQYGDWLSIPESGGVAELRNVSSLSTTPYDVFSTAYYAHTAGVMARIADTIGRLEDAKEYGKLHHQIKNAFLEAFVDASGHIKGDTQTAYVMALAMDLLPESNRQSAINRLLFLLEQREWHLSTGIHGTRFLLPLLMETGHQDIAFRIMMKETFPSWLYSVHQGATTIWERWDGWTEEKGFQRAGMNSLNHYALGSVGEWLYRYVGGIDYEEPGFKRICIHPRIGGGLEQVRCTYESIHGPISCAWKNSEGCFQLDLFIPANTTASVRIPLRSGQTVFENDKDVCLSDEIALVTKGTDFWLLDVGSGRYRFTVEDERIIK